MRDLLDMGLVVYILERSLSKRRYQSTLQDNSVRNIRSVFSNMWYAPRFTLITCVMDRDLHKTYVTLYPYYMLLVERFMVGIHKLMGGKVNQDKIV